MAATLYAGPGKAYIGTTPLFPEGEAGQITAQIEQGSDPIVSGFHGHLGETQAGMEGKISLTPLDNWSALGELYPAYMGIKVGARAAALVVGTRPHGAVNVPLKIWTPDGRLYTFVRSALIRPPDLHLGSGKPMFGAVEYSAIGDLAKAPGDAGFLYTITESSASDPGGQMAMDIYRGRWTGVWGDGSGHSAGFGGGENATPMEAEEEWVISMEVRMTPLLVQRVVRAYKFDSIRIMAKARIYGPTHTQIDTAIGINAGRIPGSRFASGTAMDLVLTGPSSKTITLKNCDVKGVGYEFGGTKLGTGEVGFVNAMTFTAGVPGGLLEFSA